MNYLVVDMGNFLTKWGVCSIYDDAQRCWHVTDSVPTRRSSELLKSWDNLSPRHVPGCVAISNVSSFSPETMMHFAKNRWNNASIYQVDSLTDQSGLNNLYKNPSKLGSDRWASVVAANCLFSSEVIVVINCGTALTADVVGRGSYWGGTIVPGFYWLERSLLEGTTLTLEDFDFADLPDDLDDFPQSTSAAVKVGACDLSIGWACRMVERVQRRFSTVPRVIISGGSGEFFYRLWKRNISIPAHYIDTLVLDGLVHISQCKLRSEIVA
ncbi:MULTISPECIES: type III pantothenate kinase [Candidatus Ichthyocystis]|uniref:type III pantothenate kinase n=1 Tax=Candidatus Ichthyocystis TaxID=2929841 RepID=UPI0015848A2B|nr:MULTISPECIES: type III pantothenate kinase [Ichthyocystis]